MATLPTVQSKQKELEAILLKIVEDNLPQAGAFSKIGQVLIETCVTQLETAISGFRDEFVVKASTKLSGSKTSPLILPQGTRYSYQSETCVLFVIEQKPTVRTLSFEYSDNYRLALPYLIFVPVFQVVNNKYHFAGLGLACRTEPLEDMSDMLYHINLPNVSRVNDTQRDKMGKPNGDVDSFAGLSVCNGNVGNKGYSPKRMKLNMMAEDTIDHFWRSEFTEELVDYRDYMRGKEPENYDTYALWQERSIVDPLFTLKSNYCPAVKLNKFIKIILESYDASAIDLNDIANTEITRIHDESWQTLIKSARDNYRVITKSVVDNLDGMLKKFATELSKGLTVITQDTIRRTVQLAISQALQAAVKQERS